METVKKTEKACQMFEEAAIKHAKATETGNYTQANKSYKIIAKTARFLRETNSIEQLSKLLIMNLLVLVCGLQHISCLFLNTMQCKHYKKLQMTMVFIH